MPAESLTDKIIEEFIESVDANNDHRISKKELKRFIADLFANQQ